MAEKVKVPMSERKPGMATNFAAAEHALSEACRLGYTPGKQGSMPTPPTAWLSHQDVKAFEIAFHKLRREYDKAVKDAEAFKAETRQLRETAEARAKRLAVSQKMFDRLVQERRSLEQTCKSQKAYIQKLEFRLSSEPRGPSLAERSVELRAGLQDARDKIAQLHNVVQSQSQDLERAAKEIKTLNRALDIKLKDESPQGHKGDESSVATLVRELAEAKVECQSLASELAVREERLQRVQHEMRQLYDELDEERAAREQAKENEAHLMATVLRGAEVATELQGQVNSVSEEKHSLTKALEDQSARNLTLEKLVASLREDNLKAAQAHKARLEAFQHKEAELQVAMEVLKEKLSKRDAVQAMTEEKLTEERRRIKTITDCLLDKDAKLRDANFERKTLCEEVESLTQRLAGGTQRATQADEAANRLRTESEELRSAFRRQEATALKMREEMESLLQDLRRVTDERDRAQEGLLQLKSMSHRQGSEEEERQRQRMTQQAELARLQENKELMQKALLEELQLTKQSLAEESQRRTSLELQVDRLRSTTISSLTQEPQIMPAATDLHAYSSNQAAWGMDEKRKKQPPQATITINPAMGRTPNPVATSRPSVGFAASSTAFVDTQGSSTRPLPRPLVMEDEQSEATNMALPPPPAPPLPLSAPAPSLPLAGVPSSGSSDRNAVLLRLQDLILIGQEVLVDTEQLLLTVFLDGDSKDITLRRNGEGRYECARDACVQFVGTLRVLRKPLAFRLPALNAELGSIAVQDAIVANRFQLQTGPWLLSGSTSLPPSENDT